MASFTLSLARPFKLHAVGPGGPPEGQCEWKLSAGRLSPETCDTTIVDPFVFQERDDSAQC